MGSASAAATAAASSASAGIVTRPLTLPFTCTGTSTVSSASQAESAAGKGARVTEPWPPRRCHSSSAKCGASGASIRARASAASRGAGPARRVSSLFSSVILAMAVLNRSPSMSERTPATVRCIARRRSSPAGSSPTRSSPVSSSTTLRHTRCSIRWDPTTERVSQGRSWSMGPMDIS